MKSKVQMWGNSLAVRIPKLLANGLNMAEGKAITISAKRGQLIIEPAEKALKLKDLIGEVTEENIHSEIDTGAPKGKEVW